MLFVRWYLTYPLSFLRKVLKAAHTQEPRGINVDKNATYTKAINELKHKKELSKAVELRHNKYRNYPIEQDHRFIKRLVKPAMAFGSFNTARRTLKGYQFINIFTKGQVKKVEKGALTQRVKLITEIFAVARQFSVLNNFLLHNQSGCLLGASRH